MRTAVEEFLGRAGRQHDPAHRARRHERRRVAHPGGRAGGWLIGAVNRDPLRLVRPDVLDIGRTANAHATFAAITCVGAPLARLEAQIALDALLDALPAAGARGTPRVAARPHQRARPGAPPGPSRGGLMSSVGIEALGGYGGAAYVDVQERCAHRGLDIQRFET